MEIWISYAETVVLFWLRELLKGKSETWSSIAPFVDIITMFHSRLYLPSILPLARFLTGMHVPMAFDRKRALARALAEWWSLKTMEPKRLFGLDLCVRMQLLQKGFFQGNTITPPPEHSHHWAYFYNCRLYISYGSFYLPSNVVAQKTMLVGPDFMFTKPSSQHHFGHGNQHNRKTFRFWKQ